MDKIKENIERRCKVSESIGAINFLLDKIEGNFWRAGNDIDRIKKLLEVIKENNGAIDESR